MKIGSNGKTLLTETRKLAVRWEQTKNFWNDAKSQEFEQKFMLEVFARVERASHVFDRLDKLLSDVKKNCE